MLRNQNHKKILAATVLILITAYILILNAWIAEDTYITFRAIENFSHGYGPVFNIGYRVQVYTHPLWFLVLSFLYAGTNLVSNGNPIFSLYYITIVFSILLTIITILALVFRSESKERLFKISLALLLLSSKSFVDYSVSGMENPLTNMLIVLYVLIYFSDAAITKRKVFLLSLIATLAILNRQDVALLFLPSLLFLVWNERRNKSHIIWLGLGFIPLVIWELFSLIYYGYLVPNTAFAKLNTGISSIDLTKQGLYYFVNLINFDILTALSIIVLSILLILSYKQKTFVIALGAILYCVYIVKIGGDFMSGRFFGAPLVLLVAALSQIPTERKFIKAIPILLIFIGLFNWRSPIYSTPFYGLNFTSEIQVDERKIGDGRGAYYTDTGLISPHRRKDITANRWNNWEFQQESIKVVFLRAIGIRGYLAGPNIIILDNYALSDPLLAKLPIHNFKNWRIGHFMRLTPIGYYESLENYGNNLQNDNLMRVYDAILLVTTKPIFSYERFKEILYLNLGRYNDEIERYLIEEYQYLD